MCSSSQKPLLMFLPRFRLIPDQPALSSQPLLSGHLPFPWGWLLKIIGIRLKGSYLVMSRQSRTQSATYAKCMMQRLGVILSDIQWHPFILIGCISLAWYKIHYITATTCLKLQPIRAIYFLWLTNLSYLWCRFGCLNWTSTHYHHNFCSFTFTMHLFHVEGGLWVDCTRHWQQGLPPLGADNDFEGLPLQIFTPATYMCTCSMLHTVPLKLHFHEGSCKKCGVLSLPFAKI